MTVELTPETERLVKAEIESGHFASVDDLIRCVLQVLQEHPVHLDSAMPRKRLIDALSSPPFAGSDLNFARQPDRPRPIEW